MAAICIRLDDVHGRTPLSLLRELDTTVWAAAPITLAVVPFPAYGCLGPTASARECDGGRATLASAAHLDYLHESVARGCDIAVHGLTHADHRRPGAGAAAELVAASAHRLGRLEKVLQDWQRRFGTSVLVPPHNYIDACLSEHMVQRGISVCRAITDREVAEHGFDPQLPDSRWLAKKVCSYQRIAEGIELFQTLSISPTTMASNRHPASVAETILEVASSAGVAVATFHWWDFAGPAAGPFTDYARRVIARLTAEPGARIATVSTFVASLWPAAIASADDEA